MTDPSSDWKPYEPGRRPDYKTPVALLDAIQNAYYETKARQLTEDRDVWECIRNHVEEYLGDRLTVIGLLEAVGGVISVLDLWSKLRTEAPHEVPHDDKKAA